MANSISYVVGGGDVSISGDIRDLLRLRNTRAVYRAAFCQLQELHVDHKNNVAKYNMDGMWTALIEMTPKNREIIRLLHQAFLKFSERRPFLQLALTLRLHEKCRDYDFTTMVELVKVQIQQSVNQWTSSTPMLRKLRIGMYDYHPQRVAYDMHTSSGRRKGANRTQFVTTGAVVQNEDMQFYDATLVQIYCKSCM